MFNVSYCCLGASCIVSIILLLTIGFLSSSDEDSFEDSSEINLRK